MKRFFDFVVASLGLILLLPLLAFISLLVKASSPGPVVFVQMRVGKDGIPFKFLKFRSMVANASMIGSSVTTCFDSRVVPIGRILRSWKLDELPQLWNVLRGDMSLVGPRPEVAEIVRFYTPQMMRVFGVRPGITSIVSLHLRNEESILSTIKEVDEVYLRVLVPFKVAVGIDYINRDSSLFFDLKLLAQTIWKLSFRRNCTSKEQPWVKDLRTEISRLCARRHEEICKTVEQSWKMLPQYIQRNIFNEEDPPFCRQLNNARPNFALAHLPLAAISPLINNSTNSHTTPRKKRIYLSPPDLDGCEKELLNEALDSNWITTLGPQVEAFEREIAEKIGVANSVALSSGTAALHLTLMALEVKPEDTVFCSDLTFAASANPITYCGATPVFIDSSPDTWNMDPALLEEALADAAKSGKLPRAVIVVDLYGQSADYDRIVPLCDAFGVTMIEDAAEALGATYGSKACGSFGAMGIFSFNGNKIITTSGGGMLLSNNKKYVENARYLATQARDPFPYYEHSSIGYNYRLSNLLAAIGRAQLVNLEKKVTRRREINKFYRDALVDIPGIEFISESSYSRSNYWLTCITIDPVLYRARSEDVRLFLEQHNIESRNVWKPMHLQPVFAARKVFGGGVSEDLFARGLCLPSGSGLFNSDLERICELIRQFHMEHSLR